MGIYTFHTSLKIFFFPVEVSLWGKYHQFGDLSHYFESGMNSIISCNYV